MFIIGKNESETRRTRRDKNNISDTSSVFVLRQKVWRQSVTVRRSRK